MTKQEILDKAKPQVSTLFPQAALHRGGSGFSDEDFAHGLVPYRVFDELYLAHERLLNRPGQDPNWSRYYEDEAAARRALQVALDQFPDESKYL